MEQLFLQSYDLNSIVSLMLMVKSLTSNFLFKFLLFLWKRLHVLIYKKNCTVGHKKMPLLFFE